MSDPTPYSYYPDNEQTPYGASSNSWPNNGASPYADPTNPNSDSPSYPQQPPNTAYPQQSYYPPPPQPAYMPYGGYRATQTNGPGIASMVLGIIGVLMFWFAFVGFPVSIVGLILAAIGMKRIDGKGFAIAGLVLSIIGVVVGGCIAAATIAAIIHNASY